MEYKLIGMKEGEIGWYTKDKSDNKSFLKELKTVLKSEVDEIIIVAKI